ncbi:MAG: phosphoenolpyruvate--protein phosphotransferase [Pseudomonadota bacterium]
MLLNRLRQMMATEGSTRDRLDKVVQLIAGNMVADVCSIYLRTPEDELELVATEGLRAEAVSSTRMRFDEGLVGQIAMTAAPISIQDAPRHPAFSYRPETGEDPYHAFLGVPLLRGGRVVGVLTMQNRTERVYGDEEVEALETIAMVLAEVVANEAQGDDTFALPSVAMKDQRPATLRGRVLSEGIGVGQARLHDPVVPAAKFFAENPATEARRLDEALDDLKASVERLLTSEISALGDDPRDVMETYKLLANDPSWAEKLHEGVRGGLSAEASVDRVRREHRARMESSRDPYLRERLHDLEDLDNRLLRALGGSEAPRAETGGVLVARRLGPAELLEYRDSELQAIVLEEAAASSHAAIVARALGITTVGGMEGLITRVESGDQVVVDGETGVVHIRPDQSLLDSYATRMTLRSERQEEFRALRDLPAKTLDGVEIQLMLNAGLRLDLDHLDTTGAAGVGLFRTEFQFLVYDTLPKLDDQIALYGRVIASAAGKPILFRTLDLGGDKMLPNLNRQREENPALGWRSIRFALDMRGLFRRQLRALIRATNGGELSVMFPMVTTAQEYFEARDLLFEEIDWSTSRGFAKPASLRVGAMLETPAFAHALEDIGDAVDFVSIGTNDLMQFFFAADRMSPELSGRYDLVSRPAMRFLRDVSRTCRRLGVDVSVCGEHTGRALEALCFIALGYNRLSMPASGIGPVKKMVRSVNLEAFKTAFFELIDERNGPFRNEVLALAAEHDIQVNES